MKFPIVDPKNMTEGLGNFVALIHNVLEDGGVEEAKRLLIDLHNDIGGAYVCLEREPEAVGVVGEYDSAVDGDYGDWLVSNNID